MLRAHRAILWFHIHVLQHPHSMSVYCCLQPRHVSHEAACRHRANSRSSLERKRPYSFQRQLRPLFRQGGAMSIAADQKGGVSGSAVGARKVLLGDLSPSTLVQAMLSEWRLVVPGLNKRCHLASPTLHQAMWTDLPMPAAELSPLVVRQDPLQAHRKSPTDP